MEYDFALKFKLADVDADANELVEKLGEAGCDDATVGVGLPGRIALHFTREAGSAQQAVFSALADVRSAIPDAELIEVSPDLVGLTDIADLVGVSRQNMRKLMLNHASTFPAPVHDGSTALWRLALVLEWLNARSGYAIEESLLEVARVALQVNLVKEMRRLEKPVESRIRALVA